MILNAKISAIATQVLAKKVLIISLVLFHGVLFASNRPFFSERGAIAAIDLQYRTLQVGEKTYGIADDLTVFAPDNTLIDQKRIAMGQEIEFSTESKAMTTSNDYPKQIITQIRIIAGLHSQSQNKLK